MPEPYTLVEYRLTQRRTMPPSLHREPMWLHAAEGGEDAEIAVACSYQVSERDVAKRDLPFFYDGFLSRMHGAPKCPACYAALGEPR